MTLMARPLRAQVGPGAELALQPGGRRLRTRPLRRHSQVRRRTRAGRVAPALGVVVQGPTAVAVEPAPLVAPQPLVLRRFPANQLPVEEREAAHQPMELRVPPGHLASWHHQVEPVARARRARPLRPQVPPLAGQVEQRQPMLRDRGTNRRRRRARSTQTPSSSGLDRRCLLRESSFVFLDFGYLRLDVIARRWCCGIVAKQVTLKGERRCGNSVG